MQFEKSGRPTIGQIKERRKEQAMQSDDNTRVRLQQKHKINEQIVKQHNRGLEND